MRKVSVVIPSLKRPKRLLRAVQSVLSTAPKAEIVCVLEAWDKPSWAILGGLDVKIVAVMQEHDSTASLWNLGASQSDADLFVVSADDVIFEPGWLEASLEAMDRLGGDGVVGFNDGDPAHLGFLATHFMVSRKYAVRGLGGVLMIPSYRHNWTDAEVTARARRDGRLAFATRARIRHEHHYYGTAKMDDVYEKNSHDTDADEGLFSARALAGFPDDFEPVLTYKPEDGWGNIAIGLRTYRNSSAQFVASWSRFLLAGLRSGDRLIDPALATGNPHHMAANILVTEFLKTDCDSLLLVDDDMVIPLDALHKMRDNKDNWGFDVVSGFCTFKTTPPHAVAYVLDENQPGMPERLMGESFNALAHLQDNAPTQVDAVGMAFTLIRRNVFELMLSEYGAEYTAWFDTGGHSEMEDVRFSRRCRERGLTMCIDTSAKIGHIGEHVYGWREHQQFIKLLEKQHG